LLIFLIYLFHQLRLWCGDLLLYSKAMLVAFGIQVSMCVIFISWRGEMTSNSRSVARTTTQQRGHTVCLNLNFHEYMSGLRRWLGMPTQKEN